MKNVFIVLILILSLGFTQAISIYGGNSYVFSFSKFDNIQKIDYEYVGGNFNYDGLSMVLGSNYAILNIPLNYKPDNFTIIFTITQSEEYSGDSNSGSSGSSGGSTTTITKTVYEKVPCNMVWTCKNWSECNDGQQYRLCQILNDSCNVTQYNIGKPKNVRACSVENISNKSGINDTKNVSVEKPKIRKVNENLSNIFKIIFFILVVIFASLIVFIYWNNITKFFNKIKNPKVIYND